MKKILLLFVMSVLSLQFFSCETDYDGDKPVNQTPDINILETSDGNLTDITSSKKTKVQWYSNDPDGAKTIYYYVVTTDTSLVSEQGLEGKTYVLDALPADGENEEGRKYWSSTDKTYAFVSMPYGPYNSDVVYLIDTTFTGSDGNGDGIETNFKAVWSKFFVYGVDENGATTQIHSKIFRRTNRIPKHPMVFSNKLGLNGFDKYWMTVGTDSAQMVLPSQTAFWQPYDFKWMGEDPDGPDVELEFKWELWERTDDGLVKVVESNGWSVNYLSKSFSREIFEHNKQGKYRLIVRVRDDAFEESINPATINFEVFAPEFDKGVLLIDDNDPTMYPPPSNITMGNPDAAEVRDFYVSLLEDAGFEPAENASDPMKGYTISTFSSAIDTTGYEYVYDIDPTTGDTLDVTEVPIERAYYSPDVRELTRYNLVIIASDDRSNARGVDFAGQPPFTGYNQYLSSLLDVGGNLFILGPSVLMGKLYTSPDQIPINAYKEPFRQVFDPNAQVVANISDGTKNFFNKYFGIYSMIFPEQKTYFFDNSSGQLCADHYLTDNYDFVGTDVYSHVTDDNFKPLKIDSARVSKAWWDKSIGTRIQRLALKDGGTVFTGVPTFEAYKGEVIYKYRSIYDIQPQDENYSYEINGTDTLKHYLWNWNYVTGEIHQEDGNPVPVLRRSGSVATRFISEGSIFKTAFFGVPTYFLDNSENQVNDMFRTMIEWFDIENNGGSK